MRTIVSGLTAKEVRSLVYKAQEILEDDPAGHSGTLLQACGKISENYDKIIDDALTGKEVEE